MADETSTMHQGWVRFSLSMALMTLLAASSLQAAAVPPGGASLLGEGALSRLALAGPQQNLAKVSRIDVAGQPFDRALRISVQGGATVEWNVQLQEPIAAAIHSGDVLLAHFYLRCDESMTGDGFVGLVIELNQPPDYPKLAERRLAAGGAWKECFVPFQARQDVPAGAARLCLRLGYDRQAVEIGGLELLNYAQRVRLDELPHTQITYRGDEPDAPWRKAALKRIDQIRKGDLSVHVVDAAGRAVPGADVQMVLRRHQFGFGTCVDADLLLGKSSDAQHYRDTIEKYFNLAVFENDMKWPAVYDGVPPATDQALQWLLERHFKVRGHNLIWPSWRWLPRQLDRYRDNPDELRKLCAEHITRVVSHFRGKLFQWDVVNEPYTNHDLQDLLGRDVLIDWYKLAHAADPSCKLYLNDFGILDGGAHNAHRQNFYETIQWMKSKDAPLDGIGIQSHFGSDLPAPSDLLSVLDQFAKLDLPIESTEVSINVPDRQVQASYLRDYMIAVFSHPDVKGIMLWGFWEGRHWRPQAALWNRDWTIRPIGQAFVDLMEKTWKTDSHAQTDAAGDATIRGFLGEYDISVSAGGKTKSQPATLIHAGTKVTIVVN